MINQYKEFTGKRCTIWFAVGGVLFVLGWRAIVMAAQYFNEPEVVRELCSVRQFEQDLTPNNANTRLVFCQDTEDGVGIYFCDTDGGKPRLLCEQKEKGIRGRRFTMLGWTHDDSLFACALPENEKDQEWVLIFDGQTGELLSKVLADQSFSQFAWLSDESFAYSTGGTSVRVVMKQSNGSWVHKRYFENVGTNMDNFIAISADTVVWRDDSGIWSLNLDSGSTEEIWEATTNQLAQFTYAKDGSGFLLNCNDDAGQHLLWFSPQNTNTFDLGRISDYPSYIRNVTWDGHGGSYAYLTNDLAGSAFCIKTGEMTMPVTISWRGGIHNLTLNGNELFFTANPDDQTPGIWEYDIPSKIFKCVVSSTSDILNRSIGNSPVCQVMTNSLGQQRFYHLWSPPHVSPNKKYPLLLAQELNSWFPCFQIAARSGCYVAVVDRPFFNTWDGDPEQTWVEDVGSLYKIMAGNLNIDTNRIYLYADSRETYFLSQWMNERPSLVKGAILFSPTGLPGVSILQNKRILIVDGKLDGDAVKRLSEFQDRAVQKGNNLTLFLQNDAGHISASGRTEREQAGEFARFISAQ